MLPHTVALQVGVKFLNAYYRTFTVNGGLSNGLQDFYASHSRVAVLGHPTLDGNATGKEIFLHLANVDRTLQERKVDILSLDVAPLPSGDIQLLCHGTLFLRSCKWSIIHVFVLSPTEYRLNTFYISSEHLCFLSLTEEKTPEGVTVLDPRQVAAVLVENAKLQQEALDRRIREAAEAAIAREKEIFRMREAEKSAKAAALRQQQVERDLEEKLRRLEEAAQEADRNKIVNAPLEKREEMTNRQDNGMARQRRQRTQGDRGEDRLQERRGEGRPSVDQRRNQGERARGQRGRWDREPRHEGTDDHRAPAQEGRKRERNPRQRNNKAFEPQQEKLKEDVADSVVAAPPQEQAGKAAADEKDDLLSKLRRAQRNKNNSRIVGQEEEEKKEEKNEAETKRNGQPPSRRSGPTKFIRIVNAPSSLSYEDIKEVISRMAEGEAVQEMHRFGHGKQHMIAKFEKEESAEKVFKKQEVEMNGEVFKVLAFYP